MDKENIKEMIPAIAHTVSRPTTCYNAFIVCTYTHGIKSFEKCLSYRECSTTYKATANMLLCMFFCWIYRLLVFGQRHNVAFVILH